MLLYFSVTVLFIVAVGEAATLKNSNDDHLSTEDFLGIDLNDVHFLLWTRSNPEDGEYYELIIDDVSNLKASPFSGEKQTVIISHGWNSQGNVDWIRNSKTEFLKYQDCNFISIEWHKIADNLDYLYVVRNLPTVGKHAAMFLDYLHAEAGLSLDNVYGTGHSLGAHLMGMMGSNVQNGPVGRITGLDPAGPEFYSTSTDLKLDPSDAVFVDVIHSNAGPVLDFCAGLGGSVGHVDFFPNGGKHQPGCTIGGDWQELLSGGCSHGRSHEYWTESINAATPFKSVPCPDVESYDAGKCQDCGSGCQDMGVHVNKQLTGTYFLHTNAESPYAQG
ncbi:pancreatic triacylglycerol lipase-like [Palaemon carinicauda]|uniref:pancreatic triacylglycerol lipase-like n=1 Tax=Palaemon carinicauda TaxID=392227 RepID=UPI0035B57FA7